MSCAPATSPILAPMGRYIFKNRSILQLLRISVFSYICVNQRNQYIQYDNMNININAYEKKYIYIYINIIFYTSVPHKAAAEVSKIGNLLESCWE